jgi:hypothetical protein
VQPLSRDCSPFHHRAAGGDTWVIWLSSVSSPGGCCKGLITSRSPRPLGWSSRPFGWSPQSIGWPPRPLGWSPRPLGWPPRPLGWPPRSLNWPPQPLGWPPRVLGWPPRPLRGLRSAVKLRTARRFFQQYSSLIDNDDVH